MTDVMTNSDYGALIAPDTYRIARRLPGPVERIWSYITDSTLRQKWLAVGEMTLQAGAEFEWTWQNDNLSVSAGERPEGMPENHTMKSTVLSVDPPSRLVMTWGTGSEVTFDLEPSDGEVLLTITHRKLMDRGSKVNVGAGWHAHLDVLAAVLGGGAPASFWGRWKELRAVYDKAACCLNDPA